MTKLLTTSLHELVWLLDRRADDMLKTKYSVSFNWFHLMIILMDVQPVTQHYLATCLNYSDPAVSKLLAKLKEAGYVTVTIDPVHKRKRIVGLTELGIEITKEASALLESEVTRIINKSGIDVKLYTSMSEQLVKATKEFNNEQ